MSKLIRIIEVNKETVILDYGLQSFCLHNYGNPRKAKFRLFKEELLKKRKLELGFVLHLAHQYEVNISSRRKC